MADAQKVIEFLFQGNDQLSSEVDKMNLSFADLASGLERATDPIANLTTGLLQTEAAVAAAGLALAAFAVNEAGKFDTSMRELTTLVNGGETELQAFSTTVQKMGQTSAVSLDDLTGAMYKAVSQTGNLEDAAAAVTQAEKLAVAGRADLTDTTLLLVGTLASYGKGMQDAARFSDVLFSVVQNGQTTLPELAAGLGNVAPTAASAGVSIADLGGAIALLTKSGIGTSEAMTGVKAALANIIAPSKEATDTAAALGINFTTAGISSKGFAGFMTEVAEKTGGSTDKISSLFGSVEAFNSVMVLTKNSGADFTAMLDSIKNGAGSTERAYALMVDTFTVKNQQIANNLRLVGIAFGTEILHPVENVQDALTVFLQSLATSINQGAFDPLFRAAEKALNDLATTLRQIAAIFPEAAKNLDFSQLLTALQQLAGTAGGLFEGVDLKTPEGLHKVLQTVIDTITTFVRVTTGITEKLGPIVRAFGEWALAGNKLSPELQKNIGSLLGLGTAINQVAPAAGQLATAIEVLSLAVGGPGLVSALKYAAPWLALLTGPVGIGVAGAAALVASDYFLDWSGSIVNAGKSMLGLAPSVEEVGHQLLEQKTGTEDLTGAMGALIGAAASAVGAHQDLTAAEREQSQALALSVTQWKLLDDTVSLIGGTFQKAADEQQTSAATTKKATNETAAAIEALLGSWREVGGVTRDATLATDLAAEGFKVAKAGTTDLATGLHYTADTFTFAGDKAVEAGDKTKDALSKTAEEALKAQQAANDFSLEWEKIASDERQLIFQLSADIAIAQIEAGTERVKAAFESVNTTIESTGTTLVGLAGILADVGTGSGAGHVIIDLMEQENKRRQEALDLQKKLVESQVRYLDAVVDQMTRGEAMIQVTSDGLEVELEQFMMKILAKVQVKANSEAQQFLLGLNG